MSEFDPAAYWNDRHHKTEGLDGVGYLGLGPFNDWSTGCGRGSFAGS